MVPRFNADTCALRCREQLNSQGSLYDLEDWIIRQVKPFSGMHILDLGCGTGKQIFALSPYIDRTGSILGLDISAPAVSEVNKRAKKAKLPQIKAIAGDLDQYQKKIKNKKFDLILSTYAIYYSKNVKKLLSKLKNNLKDKGEIFICYPGRGTNKEIFNLIDKVKKVEDRMSAIKDKIPREDIEEIGKNYSKTKTVKLPNKIVFTSSKELLLWWRHHNSYKPEIDAAVKEKIEKYFSKNNKFTLTKNVLGVHFYR